MDIEGDGKVQPLKLCFKVVLSKLQFYLLSAWFTLCLLITPIVALSAPIALTTGDNFPPFTGLTLPRGGMATSLVLEAFESSGYLPSIKWLP